MSERTTRQRRANGEESRRRILDATVEIAGERGYEGTSIKLVSDRARLPASSIYWHFQDKDALIAAVIERSFGTWLDAMTLPEADAQEASADAEQVELARGRARALARQVATSLLDTPDFLRLGLMLALERRPEEPSARTMFLQVRHVAHERLIHAVTQLAPELDDAAVRRVAVYALAAADGLFIAHEIGDDVDLVDLFELHADALVDIVGRLSTRS
ncbi:TetR/AcrR family transcriptional regulator [Actinomycetospora sp. C-140]